MRHLSANTDLDITMEGSISNVLTGLGSVIAVLAVFPTWLHWVVGIGIAVVIVGAVVLIAWRWALTVRNDIKVGGRLADAVCSTADQASQSHSSGDASRLADVAVKLETIRRSK